jgi:DNA end-binding protein Ku
MSARANWKGFLKISLVTIPIKVFPATESSESLSFNQLHAECQTRITQRKWCAHCGREVTTAEIVKGFEFEKGKYVLLQPEEIDAVQPASTKVIDLVQFADASELEPYSLDRSYFLAPDGPIAADALAVLLNAMRHRIGIGKLAIYGREYLVAVRPARVPAPATPQWVLMLHTLHHAAELRSADAIDELQGASRAPVDQVKVAQQVIAALVGPLDLADFHDEYQADLRRLIDAKIAGEEIVVPTVETPGAVLNLKAALELSLQAVRASTAAPAKAVPGKRKKAS